MRRVASIAASLLLLGGALTLPAACAATAPPSSSAPESPAAPEQPAATPAAPAPSPAASAPIPPGGERRQAGFYRTRVGAIDMAVLSDGTFGLDLSNGLVLNAKPGEVDKLLAQSFQRSPIDASFNSFLFQMNGRTILVDTGCAELMGPTTGKLPGALSAVGVSPESVTDVFLTHAHPDHVGGLVIGGKRAFPNATVHLNQKDLDYWMDKANAAKSSGMQAQFFAAAQATLQPYLDAGRVKPFTGGAEIFPGFRAEPAYGHTPGHTLYALESGGQKLVLWGDLVHIMAVQFDDPSVAVAFDVNAPMAVETRKKALADAADKGYLVAHSHAPFPGLGHVRRDGESYRWVPAPYVDDAKRK
ncbi:MBL fold metallo-hydrolase [Sorangium sp. So ce375]|uniref:MBL fold metallo-hydrolase n=1 Tax=Sorangium sp. So ce375 TaxID=3133306 RepID=UPI003F5C487C